MTSDDSAENLSTIATVLANPGGVFLSMNFVTKACVTVAVLVGVVVLVLAVVRSARGGTRSSLLAVLGNIGLAAGGLGALYSVFVTWQVASMLRETRFSVLLPSYIEIAAALLVGVVVWLIARFGNAGARPE